MKECFAMNLASQEIEKSDNARRRGKARSKYCIMIGTKYRYIDDPNLGQRSRSSGVPLKILSNTADFEKGPLFENQWDLSAIFKEFQADTNMKYLLIA